jgi:aspartyl/asparaginyl beta-hydroxylase (cupin superfamily)
MSERLEALIQAAGRAANAGRWDEAEQLWSQVRALDPGNASALYSLGVHAFWRGDLVNALESLRRAQKAAPSDPRIPLSIADVMRQSGNATGEWDAINASLTADPYFLPGLLALGDFHERHGKPKLAAVTFKNALKVAPPESHWPEMLRPQLSHARIVVERDTAEFAEHLANRLGSRREALEAAVISRWDEAVSILAGRTAPFHAEGTRFCVPRLPAIPFYDRKYFPWLEALESQTDLIRTEMENALRQQRDEFTPYITYQPGDPVNQWAELNHSRRWSTYKLWDSGEPVREHLDRCPETAKALETVEMAQLDGLCPNAMFSALAPHTTIPPHHGETNARLVVHLPLVVPDHCLYRVGFEQRRWNVGEAFVFDDSIEHEARNDSDELRVVLIFDVWNPLLSATERDMVTAMMIAAREFRSA